MDGESLQPEAKALRPSYGSRRQAGFSTGTGGRSAAAEIHRMLKRAVKFSSAVPCRLDRQEQKTGRPAPSSTNLNGPCRFIRQVKETPTWTSPAGNLFRTRQDGVGMVFRISASCKSCSPSTRGGRGLSGFFGIVAQAVSC